MDATGFAILLIAVGLILWIIARLVLRGIPSVMQLAGPIEIKREEGNADAVVMVQPGGRVLSINSRAATAFSLQEETVPDLEFLARRVRPAEKFLELCASEGQSQVLVDGHLAEVTSYKLQAQPSDLWVVVLHFPELSPELVSEGGSSSEAARVFAELTWAMGASLDVRATLQAVLENVEKLIPADLMEITLRDEESGGLIPFRFTGLPGVPRKVEQATGRYMAGEGYSGYLTSQRKALFVPDVYARKDISLVANTNTIPIRSYLGVPLLVDNELVGTIELGSMNVDSFRPEDLSMLQLLSGQAAIAILHALLYQKEKVRASEFSGLAQFAQTFGSLQDSQNLFTHLVNSIAPLLPVDILGFLLLNPEQNLLESQSPFHGLPSQFVDMYRVPIEPGSKFERVVQSQDLIISEHAAQDPWWAELKIDLIAMGAGLKDTVLVPLTSGGRMIGYLQASNHSDGRSTFTDDELRMLLIVANQAAPMIENARLADQSLMHTRQMVTLEKINSLARSAASFEEIIAGSVQELAQLLSADLAAVFLIDEERDALVFQAFSLFGNFPALPEKIASISAKDPWFYSTATGSQRSLSIPQVSIQRADIPVYKAILSTWNIESALIIPMLSGNNGIGEVWLGSKRAQFFSQTAAQVVSTMISQLTGIVEKGSLRVQTDENLQRRVEEMTALTRITRELSTSLDLKSILEMVHTEAVRTTHADSGSIWLFDLQRDSEQTPKVRFSAGEPPPSHFSQEDLEIISQGAPVYVQEASSSTALQLPDWARSALFVPFSYQQRTAGMILLYAAHENHFDAAAVDIANSLAIQASVALVNALQYEEQMRRGNLLRRVLDTLNGLFHISQNLRPDQPLDQKLLSIANAIRESTPFQIVLISVYDANQKVLKRVCALGVEADVWQDLQMHVQPWWAVQPFLQAEYRTGGVFFIPIHKRPVIPEELHTVAVLPGNDEKELDAWDPHDLLLVPLYDADGHPLGLISLDGPSDGRRPDKPTFEALELFAVQAGLMIENHLRLADLEYHLKELSEENTYRKERVSKSEQELTSLRKQTQTQEKQAQGLRLQLEKAKIGLDMAGKAYLQLDIHGVLHQISQEMLERYGFQTALIADRTSKGPQFLETVGNLPANCNPEALFGQRNPLRALLQDDHIIMVANLDVEPAWSTSPLLNALNAKSFMGVPLHLGKDHLAGILVVSVNPMPAFTNEDWQLTAQVTRQIEVDLQNRELLAETRQRLVELSYLLDFTRQLSSLEPASIFETLVEIALRIVPKARSGWAAAWNPQQNLLTPMAAQGYASGSKITDIRFSFPESKENEPLLLKVIHQGEPHRVEEINFAEDYPLSADDLLKYRQATGGKLPVSSLFVPIQHGDKTPGLLLLENFDSPTAFSLEDELLVGALVQQAAMALENAHLFTDVKMHVAQLQALTDVAGTITSSLKTGDLIDSLLDQLKAVLPYDTATLWLRDDQRLDVAAAVGFKDNESRVGLQIQVGDSALFQEMARTAQAISVGDVTADNRFPALAEPENLSWLGIPLIAKSELIGVFALEKAEIHFYNESHIQAGTTFASQAAIALENARLYEESVRRAVELDLRSQRLALLNRFSSELGSSLDENTILDLVLQQLSLALDGFKAAFIKINADEKPEVVLEVPAEASKYPLILPNLELLDRLQQSQGIFSTSSVLTEDELSPWAGTYLDPKNVKSLLIVPLLVGTDLLGWMVLQTQETYRFSHSEIELARTISNQAGIAVQNAILYAETRHLTEGLNRLVEERTRELRREHTRSQTMLRIVTELSSSLDIQAVLKSTLGVLCETLGSEQALIVMAQDGHNIYQAGEDLIHLNSDSSSRSCHEFDIAEWIIHKGQHLKLDEVASDTRFTLPSQQRDFHSLLGVPLIVGEETLGALLLLHRQPAYFVEDHVSLVEAASRQISISLNNVEMFNLIRDQSRDLAVMLRDQQVAATRSRAILEAVADGVLVTDAAGHITLFNASAERILGLEAGQVTNSSLEQLIGLFGSASRAWMRAIHQWSEDTTSYNPGEAYSEQLTLDNGRVVSVALAPVILQREFLGTVSVFRDVTHQVQVDRLKSEFVANVSHELRTPMTSIKGYAEIMLMGAAGSLNEQQERFLHAIQSNSQRLSILIDDLLDISQIETGSVKLAIQDMDFPQLVKDVVEEFRRRSTNRKKTMSFVLNIDPGVRFIEGDLIRLRQVVGNLVDNAFSYTPEGGKVIVNVHAVKEGVQFDIQDNGIGISLETQSRIFERFYRGDDPLVLETAGTGLGLAFSKTIIEMHHGRFWFASSGRRGEGSEFSFILPYHQTEGR